MKAMHPDSDLLAIAMVVAIGLVIMAAAAWLVALHDLGLSIEGGVAERRARWVQAQEATA
jgi:hypothetical protein